MFPRLLVIAHGALGDFDEVFLVLAVVVFAAMLGVSIVIALIRRNRPKNPAESAAAPAPDKPDHFRLD